MTKILYIAREGSNYRIKEVDLTVYRITKIMNSIMKEPLFRAKPIYQVSDALPGIPLLHMIWLPNGREWDTINGWRYRRWFKGFRGPKEFNEVLQMVEQKT